jgi:hypothetical protein
LYVDIASAATVVDEEVDISFEADWEALFQSPFLAVAPPQRKPEPQIKVNATISVAAASSSFPVLAWLMMLTTPLTDNYERRPMHFSSSSSKLEQIRSIWAAASLGSCSPVPSTRAEAAKPCRFITRSAAS